MKVARHHLDELGALALLVVTPLVLLDVGTHPMGSAPTSLRVLAIVTEILVAAAWLWCAAGFVVTTVRRVVRHDLDLEHGARVLDRLAVRVAGLALAVGLALGLGVSSSGAQAPTRVRPATIAAPVSPSPGPPAAPAPSAATPAPPAAATTYVVQAGDCLWSIAEHLWGDGDDWTLLANANLGHVMDDGRIFVDPSLIMPGWDLEIPSSGVASTSPALAPETTAPPQPSVAPAHAVPVRPSPTANGTSDVTPHHGAGAPRAPHRRSSAAEVHESIDHAVIGSAAVGSGLVLLGLLGRRLRRRRSKGLSLPDELVEPAIAVAQVPRAAALDATEQAVILACDDQRLGDAGLLALDERGAQLFRDGRSVWHATGDELGSVDPTDEAPAAILPLGASKGRSWSLIMPPGAQVAIHGSRASAWAEGAVSLQGELAWGALIVARGPSSPAAEGPLDSGSLVLEVVERADVHPVSAPRAQLVIGDETCDPMVTIDDGGVHVPSLGIDLTPSILGPAGLALNEQLDAVPDPFEDPFEADLTDDDLDDGRPQHLDTDGPRLRILAALPRLDGLRKPLEPKRARRATELVAYLALHRPDPVTGDRLRTRVLGTSEHDAAAKTLFNVAGAARRSLGTDEQGDPLLPSAGREGLYRLHPSVTSDLEELHHHLRVARSHQSTDGQIAHLRAALECIESEPLAGALAGYEWFEMEGHRSRLEATVEAAALELIDLALHEGLVPLAELAIERARLVAPYSESLALAAMDVAAAADDPDGLRRAFGELQRLLDEIDPGSSNPSAEEHYARLRDQLDSVRRAQASLAAMDEAPLSTNPSAPAAL